MEAVIEKECSALGGLFQTVIGDMKVRQINFFPTQVNVIQVPINDVRKRTNTASSLPKHQSIVNVDSFQQIG